ncbi:MULTISPECIES: type II toxin-antitoxin system HipA family toxin [Flavobacterium]|uniref:type II toxin-antitoxin system HipA family toxin n=1 Tax=Flavobacterium TaxID=237 RepID=UPI001FCB9FA5|nr:MULTISPECIES: type II toxin-antitoxin system HipA family toxin [Flavobacterium]UOK42513.1 type II toxin-antitoxin system HipA family toxin [Flavobacterium enshiense]
MITTAFIKIWGETVGAVAWNPETRIASFEYDSKFITKKWDLAPLKMSVANSNKRVFSFHELRDIKTFRGLPGLLADVLPDDYGNQLINSWLAQNGRPENSMNPVELLCFIGTRGMGALEFEPSQFRANKRAFDIEVDSLVSISQKILKKREGFETNLNGDEQQAMMDILKIGTSAGGARPKAIIAFNEKTGQVKSGQTKAPKGFEHWLIKLDTVSDVQFGESTGYGRIEMAYYLMAKACEIEMMECRLMEENGRAHFMTKRFDREDGDIKHHIQTLCAMQHYDFNQITSFSYEQLFQTMRVLKLPYPEAEQLFRRMAFNVIARNCDDHTKNFAFRLKQNESWELAPAYDICFAYRPDSEWVSQHNLSINGKRKGITKEDLLNVAKSMNIKKAGNIIQQINDTVSKWAEFAEEAKVEKGLMERISKSHLIL